MASGNERQRLSLPLMVLWLLLARRTKCHGAKKSSSKSGLNWNAGRCVKTGEEELVDVHEPLDCV